MSELFYLTQYKKTTLNVAGGINDTQTTGIVLQNVDGVDKTKPGIIAISYSEPLDTSQVEFITYTSINASNELQGVTRGAEGFSAKSHANGATVAFILSKSHLNNLIDAYESEHNTDGTHSDITADSLDVSGDTTLNTLTTSGLADLNSLKIASGSTQITSILDEDDLGSNSATALATQQSIKAYVDNGNYNAIGGRMYLNTNQAIGTSVQKFNLDTSHFAYGGIMCDTTNHRIIVPKGGLYLISGAARFNTTVNNDSLTVSIRKNGSQKAYIFQGSVANNTGVLITLVYSANANDYFELWGANTTRSDTVIGYQEATWLNVAFLGCV